MQSESHLPRQRKREGDSQPVINLAGQVRDQFFLRKTGAVNLFMPQLCNFVLTL